MRLWIVALLVSTFTLGGCSIGWGHRHARSRPVVHSHDAYDARLSAAKSIMSMSDQCDAFEAIALAAAADGRADVVKRAVGGMSLMNEQSKTASQSALILADAGKLAEAVEIAKMIPLISVRSETLKKLATRSRTSPAPDIP